MKRIIIPTDFSPVADNAIHYGAQLAQAIEAEVLLLHVYMIPITINEMPVIVLSADELKKGADIGLARHKEELHKAYPALQVSVESRLGEVVEELKTICDETAPFAVVMSTHSSSAAEKMLFGSNAISAIRKINKPLITVPEGHSYQPIKSIVLATDLQQVEKTPATQIMELVKTLGAQLHVVHIASDKETENKEEAATQLLNLLQPVNPDYAIIKDEHFIHGLEAFTNQVQANLLIALPHEHNWMESFFFKLHIKDMVKKVHLPVLSIPYLFKTQHS
jgi:nucleotide-binding universal stress UspA family protein